MKKTRRLIVIVASAAGVILVALAVVFALTTTVKADYAGRISRGNNYLKSGDYDKAVIEFQDAMEMDENRTEAYEGLSDAYEGLGYRALSRETLEKGVLVTGDSGLRLMLAQRYPESPYASESGEDIESVVNGEEGEPALNSTLLALISGATYGDYDHEYEVELVSSDSGTYQYNVKDLGIDLIYKNNGSTNKINQGQLVPYREFMPDEVRVNDLSYLFGYAGKLQVATLEGLNGIQNFSFQDGVVTFEADHCRITLFADEAGNILNGAESQIVSLKATGELEEETEDKKTLMGKITDAATGKPIAGASVKAYVGYSEYGEAISTESGSDGSYSLDVEGGNNFIVVEKEGYIKGTFEVYVLSNSSNTYEDFAISGELGEGEIRIVLTWGDSPRDLDSYLRGTTGEGRSIQTSYRRKTEKDSNGNIIAELDLDDTNGNGPETTTLYDMQGTYEFVVVDYHMTGTMARSGAQVKVYKGNGLVETVDINSSVENLWRVIKIDHGEISVVNEAFNESTQLGNK